MNSSQWRIGFLLCISFFSIPLSQCEMQAYQADRDLREVGEQCALAAHQEIGLCLYPRAIDKVRGGFHQTFDAQWNAVPDAEASIVAQSRHVWTCAAYAAFAPERKEEFQRYALDGLSFIDSAFYDPEYGGYYWALGPDGRPDASRGRNKHTYGVAFVLYAAAEVYALTQDPLAAQVADRAFQWLDRVARDSEHGGYLEYFEREGKPVLQAAPNAPAWALTDPIGTMYGFKSMNSHIHVLEALAAWYRAKPQPKVRERLEETLKIVRDRIAVEPGVLCLFFTRDWRATAAHDSFGHDIETAYLLIEAIEALGIPEDETTWRVAKKLVDHTLDWGFDGERGGIYDKGEAWGQALDTTKIWWVQAEGLNALVWMHHRFGKSTGRYRDAVIKQWRFIQSHCIDREQHGWYWQVDAAGVPTGESQKANAWKAAYHTGRSLMNASRILLEQGR